MDPLYIFLFTKLASTPTFFIISLLIALNFFIHQRYKEAWLIIGTTLGVTATVEVVKNILQVPRPDLALIEVAGYALPSGHAAGSMFLAIIVAYLARKLPITLRSVTFITCALAALSIGLSRVDFGVHTYTQVLVGYAVGAAWAIIYITVSRYLQH